ncbi:Hpt domain-containing protein [Arthrobacter sp. H5]|uniref:Hpt domain-containing protein n=1 Tax=Arthrobacter sp. H5 TaxID=1267973 RepID=UPI0004B17B01|nr:Hpt domain-containing protein [Arthrobacter sp. H5]
MALTGPSADNSDADALRAVSAASDDSSTEAQDRPHHNGQSRVTRVPLVDPVVLHNLEDELESPDAARAFVRDFVRIWDERDSKLSTAIASKNQAASLDAVLSLKITSKMVGAAQLAGLAGSLEELLREGELEGAASALPRIHDCGLRTVRELAGRHHLDLG